MDLGELLKKLEHSDKQEHLILYKQFFKILNEKNQKNIFKKPAIDFPHIILLLHNDFNSDEKQLKQIVLQILGLLLPSEESKTYLDVSMKKKLIKDIIKVLKLTQDKVLSTKSFWCLAQILHIIQFDTEMILNILQCLDVLSTENSETVAMYYEACCLLQRLTKECGKEMENHISKFLKLIFVPLFHPASKIREVALITFELFLPSLLAHQTEASAALVQLFKTPCSKNLLHLFQLKHEKYVLKIWGSLVTVLGKGIHKGCSLINNLLEVVEKGFKSSLEDVRAESFVAWQSLISNFASDLDVLCNAKRLRLLLHPLKMNTDKAETVIRIKCDTWWHLTWNLADKLSNNFDQVCIPLLEFTLASHLKERQESSLSSTAAVRSGPKIELLQRKGCEILIRFLELPHNSSFSNISSPKKLPSLSILPLQSPIQIAVLIRHLKELIKAAKIVIKEFGKDEKNFNLLDALLKLLLVIVSSVPEDGSKESIDAVTSFLQLLVDMVKNELCTPSFCLKHIDNASMLPRRMLTSHYYNISNTGIMHGNPSVTLISLMLHPSIMSIPNPNTRFMLTFSRLVKAGIQGSLSPLSYSQTFVELMEAEAVVKHCQTESLLNMWTDLASTLLETLQKTQEVNQGDCLENDFSCMFIVLTYPIQHIIPANISQGRLRQALAVWTNLFKLFARCASMVPAAEDNTACEGICQRINSLVKDEYLEGIEFFESLCLMVQVILESVDYGSLGKTGRENALLNAGLWAKHRQKPLGNITALVNLLVRLLNAFYQTFLQENEDEKSRKKMQTKAGQSKLSIILIEMVKTVVSKVTASSVIPALISQIAEPLSKFYLNSNKKKSQNKISIPQLALKLDTLWNHIANTIQLHYNGPYDSDFLLAFSPLLESTLLHPKRSIHEKSRQFWFATFSQCHSCLNYAPSLKTVLKKVKPSLVPGIEISPTEEFTTVPSSIDSQDDIHIPEKKQTTWKSTFAKQAEHTKVCITENVKAVVIVNKGNFKSPVRLFKPTVLAKSQIDELPDEEFVRISSPAKGKEILTDHQKEAKKQKSYVPALYNDLSQESVPVELSMSSQEDSCVVISAADKEREEPVVKDQIHEDDCKNTENINKKEQENEIQLYSCTENIQQNEAADISKSYINSENDTKKINQTDCITIVDSDEEIIFNFQAQKKCENPKLVDAVCEINVIDISDSEKEKVLVDSQMSFIPECKIPSEVVSLDQDNNYIETKLINHPQQIEPEPKNKIEIKIAEEKENANKNDKSDELNLTRNTTDIANRPSKSDILNISSSKTLRYCVFPKMSKTVSDDIIIQDSEEIIPSSQSSPESITTFRSGEVSETEKTSRENELDSRNSCVSELIDLKSADSINKLNSHSKKDVEILNMPIEKCNTFVVNMCPGLINKEIEAESKKCDSSSAITDQNIHEEGIEMTKAEENALLPLNAQDPLNSIKDTINDTQDRSLILHKALFIEGIEMVKGIYSATDIKNDVQQQICIERSMEKMETSVRNRTVRKTEKKTCLQEKNNPENNYKLQNEQPKSLENKIKSMVDTNSETNEAKFESPAIVKISNTLNQNPLPESDLENLEGYKSTKIDEVCDLNSKGSKVSQNQEDIIEASSEIYNVGDQTSVSSASSSNMIQTAEEGMEFIEALPFPTSDLNCVSSNESCLNQLSQHTINLKQNNSNSIYCESLNNLSTKQKKRRKTFFTHKKNRKNNTDIKKKAEKGSVKNVRCKKTNSYSALLAEMASPSLKAKSGENSVICSLSTDNCMGRPYPLKSDTVTIESSEKSSYEQDRTSVADQHQENCSQDHLNLSNLRHKSEYVSQSLSSPSKENKDSLTNSYSNLESNVQQQALEIGFTDSEIIQSILEEDKNESSEVQKSKQSSDIKSSLLDNDSESLFSQQNVCDIKEKKQSDNLSNQNLLPKVKTTLIQLLNSTAEKQLLKSSTVNSNENVTFTAKDSIESETELIANFKNNSLSTSTSESSFTKQIVNSNTVSIPHTERIYSIWQSKNSSAPTSKTWPLRNRIGLKNHEIKTNKRFTKIKPYSSSVELGSPQKRPALRPFSSDQSLPLVTIKNKDSTHNNENDLADIKLCVRKQDFSVNAFQDNKVIRKKDVLVKESAPINTTESSKISDFTVHHETHAIISPEPEKPQSSDFIKGTIESHQNISLSCDPNISLVGHDYDKLGNQNEKSNAPCYNGTKAHSSDNKIPSISLCKLPNLETEESGTVEKCVNISNLNNDNEKSQDNYISCSNDKNIVEVTSIASLSEVENDNHDILLNTVNDNVEVSTVFSEDLEKSRSDNEQTPEVKRTPDVTPQNNSKKVRPKIDKAGKIKLKALGKLFCAEDESDSNVKHNSQICKESIDHTLQDSEKCEVADKSCSNVSCIELETPFAVLEKNCSTPKLSPSRCSGAKKRKSKCPSRSPIVLRLRTKAELSTQSEKKCTKESTSEKPKSKKSLSAQLLKNELEKIPHSIIDENSFVKTAKENSIREKKYNSADDVPETFSEAWKGLVQSTLVTSALIDTSVNIEKETSKDNPGNNSLSENSNVLGNSFVDSPKKTSSMVLNASVNIIKEEKENFGISNDMNNSPPASKSMKSGVSPLPLSPLSRSQKMVRAAMRNMSSSPDSANILRKGSLTNTPSPQRQRIFRFQRNPSTPKSSPPKWGKHIYSPSASPSASILKKRKFDDPSTPSPPTKKRKVSFAEPPVQGEILIEPEMHLFEMRPVSRCLQMSKDDLKRCRKRKLDLTVTNERKEGHDVNKHKIAAPCNFTSLMPSPSSLPSTSSTFQNSDDSELGLQTPIYPELIECKDPVDCLLPHLTSSIWARGLRKLMLARSIKTVGDLSALTAPEIKGLPIKSPKLKTVHKILSEYVTEQKKQAALESICNSQNHLPLNKNKNNDKKVTDISSCDQDAQTNFTSDVCEHSIVENMLSSEVCTSIDNDNQSVNANKDVGKNFEAVEEDIQNTLTINLSDSKNNNETNYLCSEIKDLSEQILENSEIYDKSHECNVGDNNATQECMDEDPLPSVSSDDQGNKLQGNNKDICKRSTSFTEMIVNECHDSNQDSLLQFSAEKEINNSVNERVEIVEKSDNDKMQTDVFTTVDDISRNASALLPSVSSDEQEDRLQGNSKDICKQSTSFTKMVGNEWQGINQDSLSQFSSEKEINLSVNERVEILDKSDNDKMQTDVLSIVDDTSRNASDLLPSVVSSDDQEDRLQDNNKDICKQSTGFTEMNVNEWQEINQFSLSQYPSEKEINHPVNERVEILDKSDNDKMQTDVLSIVDDTSRNASNLLPSVVSSDDQEDRLQGNNKDICKQSTGFTEMNVNEWQEINQFSLSQYPSEKEISHSVNKRVKIVEKSDNDKMQTDVLAIVDDISRSTSDPIKESLSQDEHANEQIVINKESSCSEPVVICSFSTQSPTSIHISDVDECKEKSIVQDSHPVHSEAESLIYSKDKEQEKVVESPTKSHDMCVGTLSAENNKTELTIHKAPVESEKCEAHLTEIISGLEANEQKEVDKYQKSIEELLKYKNLDQMPMMLLVQLVEKLGTALITKAQLSEN